MEQNRFLYYLNPFLRLIFFILLILLGMIPLGMLVSLFAGKLDDLSLKTQLLSEAVMLLSVLGALMLIFKTNPLRSFDNIFLVKKDMLASFLKGSAMGLGLMVLCGLILLASGNVAFSFGNVDVKLFVGYFLLFILVAFFEELAFRSYVLVVFAERYPTIIAILINGLLFGAIHMANPGFTIVGMVNIALAGILFAIFALQKKSLWWPIGIHFGWNFTQGSLLGYKVSGTDAPGLLVAKPIGNAMVSGGEFGIEGSIVCTVVMLVLIIWLLVRYRIEPIEEPFEADYYINDDEEDEFSRTR